MLWVFGGVLCFVVVRAIPEGECAGRAPRVSSACCGHPPPPSAPVSLLKDAGSKSTRRRAPTEDDALRAAVVARRQRAEALLARGVPHRQLDAPPAEVEVLDAKVDACCWVVLLCCVWFQGIIPVRVRQIETQRCVRMNSRTTQRAKQQRSATRRRRCCRFFAVAARAHRSSTSSPRRSGLP